MHRLTRSLAIALVCAGVVVVLARPGSAAAADAAQTAPVASLDPVATRALWQQLSARAAFRPLSLEVDPCRPVRATFYAATDWLRLATKLAAGASPCAQYLVSVPPIVADKTRPRPDQAWRIRALGPGVRALAEIHITAWEKWVASTGSSWNQAGVEARRRMAAAGYDVAAGDTWAVNELSSAVRRGDGARRTDVRDFLRGLYDAGGEGPPTRGVVFVVGIGQRVTTVGPYKARMQEWLQDAPFWAEMSQYVSDWSQEVYGDVRSYAAPGAPTTDRREVLVDYLRHFDLLASAGGTASGTANGFFASTASALGNAAWQWESAFGWTAVPDVLMQHFVSAQVYALRNHGARSGRPDDRFGFAWAPRNAEALPTSEFARRTGALLDRLAAAIRDSGLSTPQDPGVGACGASGVATWCAGELEGAALSPRWRTFRTWSPTTFAFTSAPQAVAAGVVSAPVSVQVQVAGAAARPVAPLTMTVSASSPTGLLATSTAGPFAPAVTIPFAAGTFGSAQLFYQDATAGTVTLTAAAAGVVSGTQTLTVTGAAPVSLRLVPSTTTLEPGATATFTAVGVDPFGNAAPAAATWTLAPASLGTLTPATGPTVKLVAGQGPATGQVTATVTTPAGPLTATATVTVTAPPVVRVASVRYGVARRQLHVYVTVVDGRGQRVRDARATAWLYRNDKVYARAAGPTTSGRMTFSRPASWGDYRVRVTRVTAEGRTWDGVTPPNSFRKKQRPRAR